MTYSMVIVYLERSIFADEWEPALEWINSNVVPSNFQNNFPQKIYFTYKEDAAKFAIMFAELVESMIVCPVIEV